MMRHAAMVLLVVSFAAYGMCAVEEAYYDVPLRSLALDEPGLPTQRSFMRVAPYAILDGEGEVYLHPRSTDRWGSWHNSAFYYDNTSLAVRSPAGVEVKGRLCIPRADGNGMLQIGFRVPPSAATEDARREFWLAKREHYEMLLRQGGAGAAWFRYQARIASQEHEDAAGGGQPPGIGVPLRVGDLADTYSLFTGGRAVSENLQLDRLIEVEALGEAVVDVESLTGITVAEMDWAVLTGDLQVELDPLAEAVPADQYAVFFPSFQAVVTLLDEAEANGTPVLELLEARSEDAMTRMRYERQLCISTDALSRTLGPQLIKSAAVTGSDPYLRTGSDVAVLFESANNVALMGLLGMRIEAACGAASDVERVEGRAKDVAYTGAASPDRRVSAYLASVGSTVIVTNSLHQLERLVDVLKETQPALASLGEYRFFRTRYRRGDAKETAFLMVPDAAIRKWCGPRWRIANSRRTRAAAFMSDLQARHMDGLMRRTAGGIKTEMPLPDAGALSFSLDGVRSYVYGTLEFLTPIAEIPLVKVTRREADAYEMWRSNYQSNWRRYFDPIAVRFFISPEEVSADLTVMPLIAGSEYREVIDFTGSAAVAPDSGDVHPGTLAHVIVAVDAKSQPVQEFGSFAVSSMPASEASPLAWLGPSIEIYAEDSPFWEELEQGDMWFSLVSEDPGKLPVALRAASTNPLQLAAFLTATRAFIETTSPGMTSWTVLKHGEQAYVKVSASPEFAEGNPGLSDYAVWYAAVPDALVVTLNEEMLKAALERRAAKVKGQREGSAAPPAGDPWLGESLGVRLQRRFIDVFTRQYRSAMRARSWSNIPILNEWHRLYGDQDPVDVHQRIWKTRLVCPGGGQYVWNEEWRTMMSTAFGHPGEPLDGPGWPDAVMALEGGDFGLTFEHQGLRARAVLRRAQEEP